MAPSPYGFDGTEAWLRTVPAETGREDGLEDLLEGLRAPRRARWDDLVGRARGVSLALVARDNEAGQLLDRAFTWGIPLLTTLPEMGFDLDVLLLSTDEEATRSARERFADAGLGEAVELRFFDSFDDMLRMLEQSPSRAVFSSFFYDWRATSTGKAIFSLQHFEPGFEGAVRTLERLLEVCGTSFYARYGRYLRRDRCGRPVGRRR